MQAARDNINDAPGIYVKVGLESMRGTQRFIDDDLPRAFSRLDDLHILGDLADTSTDASAALGAFIDYLENDLAPKSKGSFRLGRERFEEKLRISEGLSLDADALLAIATRELHQVQEEFRRVAGASERRRSSRRVGTGEGRPSSGGAARSDRAGTARRAGRLHRTPAHRLDPAGRAG